MKINVPNYLVERLDILRNKMDDRKEDFEKLIVYVDYNTMYFNAPASTRWHLNKEFGLLEHSLNVAEGMLLLREGFACRRLPIKESDITVESCIIVGLMHDLGKAGTRNNPYYLKKEPTDKQKQYGYKAYPPYEYNTKLKPVMTVPQRSVRTIMEAGFPLTDDEYQAILIHDGQYVPENKAYACKEEPLSLLAHYADSWAGFILEGSVDK